VEPPFKNYLFIERSQARCAELEKLKKQFPERASSLEILPGDANEILVSWVGSQNWNKTRAVVFLDPYGMQVDWGTLKALGGTCGVEVVDKISAPPQAGQMCLVSVAPAKTTGGILRKEKPGPSHLSGE
jgi:three-Cys-motif partner protein